MPTSPPQLDQATTARTTRLTPEKLLEGLNPPQREAVLHEGGPVLVVAGGGGGQNPRLTPPGPPPGGRVLALIGNRAKLMWVSTFHSACVRILRSEIGRFHLARTFSIYDDADSKRLMQLVAHDLDLDPKRFPVRAILNWVSARKNDLVDHETALAGSG